MRLFAWGGQLWCISTLRELTPEGWCEQVLARIEIGDPANARLTDWRVLHPDGPRLHEKNWMPLVDADQLQFVYLCDPTRILDDTARTITETLPAIKADQFRGSSQAISFDGGWLALIHEARVLSGSERRTYHHRFVWLDNDRVLRGVSRAFFFHRKAVEFAAGLAWHPDGKRLMVSFSVDDHESWIATIDADDVRGALQNVERLPSGAPIICGRPERSSVSGTDATPRLAANVGTSTASTEISADPSPAKSTDERFLELAPFLRGSRSSSAVATLPPCPASTASTRCYPIPPSITA
jgi:hypothetical protein